MQYMREKSFLFKGLNKLTILIFPLNILRSVFKVFMFWNMFY